ncbi:2-oxoacid:acceptor oxidoreductase subunit alpha [Chlorobium sp.]|uniref:2-oxoacid:acceptor oxidoreductase subunit alpha n=1 Tax=Chlorobium sp. TaxID=1095 RepID=UPI003C482444
MRHYSSDISIVFGGGAGQGIQTIALTLVNVLKRSRCHVFACTEFMSRVRGGSNSTQVRITGKKRHAYVNRIDFLFALNADAIEHLKTRIAPTTMVFADKNQVESADPGHLVDTPITAFARQAGNPIYSSTAAVAVALGLLGIPQGGLDNYLREIFADKGESVVADNIEAARLGYAFGRETALREEIEVEIAVEPEKNRPKELLLDGTAAVGIGAVAAGCTFISSYPMSPGTGVLTFLAQRSHEFSIVVDQAEDEIAAINTALGASYAGARAIVTTSGGGFALMEEGISLAGMTEVPLVVHLGQRPGPATGMPTRTEQGDLSLVLHAGHGEFPRVILAPGTFAEAILLTQRAFQLADRYQLTVFVLTDQFFLDSAGTVPESAVRKEPIERHIVETDEEYMRYRFTPDGLSPRGVPGYGKGIVKCDSHEHDETGHLTENFETRRRMVEKRLRRINTLAEESLMPELVGGSADAPNIVVAWGSNRGVLEESLDTLQRADLAGLHFSQLYPINPSVAALLKGKIVTVLENNASGQFADLLHRELAVSTAHRILKWTGEPFSVEEVVEALREI